MYLDRRQFVALAALASPVVTTSRAEARPDPAPAALPGIDVTQFGARPGSPDDQTRVLQRAIDDTARTRSPLALPPGIYRAGDLKLPSGAHLVGTRGATSLLLTQGPSLVSAAAADHVTLAGLAFEGGGRTLPDRRGLVQLETCAAVRITDCEIKNSGRSGLV